MAGSHGGKRLGAGRPGTGKDPSVIARMPTELIAQVDAWAAAQQPAIPRSEAIRRLVELGLTAVSTSPDLRYQEKARESASKAQQLAKELGLKTEK